MTRIKNRIRMAREMRAISREQLAGLVGVSVPTIVRWETDRTSPPIDKAKTVAKVLGMTLDDIFLTEEVIKKINN